MQVVHRQKRMLVEHADQHRGITLAWQQLCKGPEAGMFLAEASSWRGEEGAREEEATITRFGRTVDTVKPVSSFLLWNVRPGRVGPAGGGECWRYGSQCLGKCGNCFVGI